MIVYLRAVRIANNILKMKILITQVFLLILSNGAVKYVLILNRNKPNKLTKK